MESKPIKFAHRVLFDEIRRFLPTLNALELRLIVNRSRRIVGRKRPYFACRYDHCTLENVNIAAFTSPLLGDWELLERSEPAYRERIRAAFREELIHAVQVITARSNFQSTASLRQQFSSPEAYYEHVLQTFFSELTADEHGREEVLNAARLYYEDRTITTLEKLRMANAAIHNRASYMASELVRQLVQIRAGEPTSEEAKGKAWDRQRTFRSHDCLNTQELLRSMADALRRAVPRLVCLSPTLEDVLTEIERVLPPDAAFDGRISAN